jgi:hypothetical protein
MLTIAYIKGDDNYDEKTVNINNFIGVYDNYITKEECNKAIKTI